MMTSCGSVLVTGANRGIGLEFVRQLVRLEAPPQFVFATYRDKNTTEALEQIKESTNLCQLILIQMDVTQVEEVRSMRELVERCVGEKGLNLLINNAGSLKRTETSEALSDLTAENMLFHISTNTMGPITVLKELIPLLQKASASREKILTVYKTIVVNISSLGGSIGQLEFQPLDFLEDALAYKTSKAALNFAMRNIALILKDQEILIVNMCPGWVKTSMGSDMADLSVEESVSCMLNTLVTLDQSRNGDFLDRNGEPIPF